MSDEVPNISNDEEIEVCSGLETGVGGSLPELVADVAHASARISEVNEDPPQPVEIPKHLQTACEPPSMNVFNSVPLQEKDDCKSRLPQANAGDKFSNLENGLMKFVLVDETEKRRYFKPNGSSIDWAKFTARWKHYCLRHHVLHINASAFKVRSRDMLKQKRKDLMKQAGKKRKR